MTSKNLFSEKKVCGRIWGLMKEDIKRRIWVLALMFLAFFFALPVKLALVMENARRMESRARSKALSEQWREGTRPGAVRR